MNTCSNVQPSSKLLQTTKVIAKSIANNVVLLSVSGEDKQQNRKRFLGKFYITFENIFIQSEW